VDRQYYYEQAQRALQDWRTSRDKERLDAAVETFRVALALPWNGSEEPGPAHFMEGMMAALTEGAEADLAGYTDNAINVTSQFIDLVNSVPTLWANRGYNRKLRYDRHGNLDDLNGAIADFEEAVLLSSSDDPRIHERTLRLAQLYLRDRSTPERARAALQLVEGVLAEMRRDDPLYPKLLHLTAMALRLAEGAGDDARGPDGRAARLDRDAWLLSLDPAPQEAISFAREWADWAWSEELWAEAAQAYDGAQVALARVVLRETPSSERLDLLADHAYYGPRGAYAYAKMQQPRQAAVLLERAGSLLSHGGAYRRAIEQLAAIGREDLRDRLQAAAREVLAAHAQAPADAYGRRSSAQLEAQARANAVVKEIRALPGFASFMTAGGWDDIRSAAATCPLAYLAPTDQGTVALIVRRGAEAVDVGIWEPSEKQIYDAVRGFMEREFGDVRTDSREALMAALEWLGMALMRGVHEAVGDQPVVLVPFLMLAQLPLHAAFVSLRGPDPSTPRIHFLFHPRQVSYAYSARALSECRDRRGRPAPTSALVVNNPLPLPPAFDPLLLADIERDAVAHHFSTTELKGADATGEAILDALPDADVAHLSCHGTVDRASGYSGILLVADRRFIGIGNLADLDKLRARLVVLSACRTGVPAIGVSQVVSLPNALIGAGAAAVIATFWHAEEMATLLIVTKFYDLWRGGAGMSPGEALGNAQGWLAQASADELRAYAPAAALRALSGRTPLSGAPGDARPYVHPWFWAPFFLVGA
jgi:CHAT domain-containing protein